MNKITRALGLTLLLASVLLAAPAFPPDNITGKWTGSFVITMDGETRDDTAYMDLKQTGTELTGSAGPSEDRQWPIQKGKVEGDKLTFEVQTEQPIIKFELTLTDGHLKGNAKAEHEGKSMNAVIDVTRKAN